MSNAPRGTVTLEVGGKVYTLRLTINAICELEDALSTPNKPVTFKEITEAAEKGSLRHVRAVFWAALLERHPEMTLKDAGALISEVGLTGLSGHLSELGASLSPDPRDLAELSAGSKKRPQRAQVA